MKKPKYQGSYLKRTNDRIGLFMYHVKYKMPNGEMKWVYNITSDMYPKLQGDFDTLKEADKRYYRISKLSRNKLKKRYQK